MELDEKNIQAAIGLKEDLDFIIHRLKTNKLEYMKVEDLEEVRREVDKDIKEYRRKQDSLCPASLKIGAIIQIRDGDGISYTQRDYYYITSVTNSEVYYDLISVIRGDYGNSINVDKNSRCPKEDWIKRYNKNSHKDDIPENEWNELLEYAEKIPWAKED